MAGLFICNEASLDSHADFHPALFFSPSKVLRIQNASVMALQDGTPKACGRTTAETIGNEN